MLPYGGKPILSVAHHLPGKPSRRRTTGGFPQGARRKAQALGATRRLLHQAIREMSLLRGQDGLRGEAPEEVEEHGNDAGPPGLVARPEAGAVVAVKVLVEQQQIAP